MNSRGRTAPPGLVIVDKPDEWTSHDVVGRLRRLAGTRKVGHAGTLDPMATGVLVCGIGGATRLLGKLSLSDKAYEATIRLGSSTTTDDAQGDVLTRVAVKPDVASDSDIMAAIGKLTGDIEQRPSSVSAIKIDGKRAYARVRAGEDVKLSTRPVTVSAFELVRVTRLAEQGAVDIDVRVECSTGTYVRALARDLGVDLGVGGHLTSLRRTRVGPFNLDEAHTLEALGADFTLVPLSQVCRRLFDHFEANADQARLVLNGGRLDWPDDLAADSQVAIFDPDGVAIALAEQRKGRLAPIAVWPG
jgi:tRNA pseudouridine55 synthase